MPIAFEFATAVRVVFGWGRLAEVGPMAREFGRRALLVRGASAGASARVQGLQRVLERAGVSWVGCPLASEPSLEDARHAASRARAEGCDLVVACGGGAVLDLGKAAAALLTNPGDPLDYLEVVGSGLPLSRPSAPLLALPTTAGTGSEVTRNAVLSCPEHGVKASMRSHWMLPRVALVDPELTMGLPPHLTASTGMDALTQLFEPFVCRRAQPLTDALCRDGLGRVARSLRRACAGTPDREAREDMALASLFGGMALANSGLGVVHGLAAPLGGALQAPHGALCAAILPHAVEVNLAALRVREPESPLLERFHEAARLLTGRQDAAAQDGVRWLQDLVCDLKIPGLASLGCRDSDLEGICAKARAASSFKANPVPLEDSEIREILQRAL